MTMTVEKGLFEPKTFKRRWFVLFLYVVVCPTIGLQCTLYTMVADVITEYYNVSYEAVNWTNLIFLLSYVMFAFPCSYIIDKHGIRITLLLITIATCISAWIKASFVSSNSFWAVLVGQVILSIPQACLQNLPPKIAADWFGANEVSMACSIGTSGIQIAMAAGFLLPPLLIQRETVQNDLFLTGLGIAIICTFTMIVIVLFFTNKPPVPPSFAAIQQSSSVEYIHSVKQLLKNRALILSVIGAGLNVTVFCVLQTLLNQIILKYYPNGSEDVGLIGVLMVILGLFGSIGAGIVLDKFRIYRALSLSLDVLIVFVSIAFAFTLSLHIVFPYVLCTLFGALMLTKWVVTYEIAIETSYPEPGVLVVGLINTIGQALGIAFTYVYSFIFYEFNDLWANLFLSLICIISLFLIAFSKFELRRLSVNTQLTKTVQNQNCKY